MNNNNLIVVVEDDPEVAEFLVRVLRESAWAPDAVRTGEAALAAMRAALEATPRGPAPDLETIASRLGGFSSASDGSDGAGPTRERRRRRG